MGNSMRKSSFSAKSLRAEYKNPDQIAHKVLADRANERGSNSFGSSDRVPYLFFAQKDTKNKILTGEKIETPEFLRQNGLKIDYKHYLTNQIAKPVAQIFGLVFGPNAGLQQMQLHTKTADRQGRHRTDSAVWTILEGL